MKQLCKAKVDREINKKKPFRPDAMVRSHQIFSPSVGDFNLSNIDNLQSPLHNILRSSVEAWERRKPDPAVRGGIKFRTLCRLEMDFFPSSRCCRATFGFSFIGRRWLESSFEFKTRRERETEARKHNFDIKLRQFSHRSEPQWRVAILKMASARRLEP